MRGTVLQCGKYGCVVRLADGRFAVLPVSDPDFGAVRRAAAGGRRPSLSFELAEERGRRVSLKLAPSGEMREAGIETHDEERSLSSLDQKIIDYLRQTAEWDPNGSIAARAQTPEPSRADRLLPFEVRARRQYRDEPKRPRRRKR